MDDEKAFDDFLSIDTTLCIGAEQPTEENNIYQATYYRDLVTLFNAVSMEPVCCFMATQGITAAPRV